MTFSVNGIKQEKTEKYSVEMLICVDASLLVRKLLEQRNIMILSLKEFTEDKQTFGDIYFTIDLNYQVIEIVTKYKDIQEAANFFSYIGFDITHINSYSKPISPEQMASTILQAQTEANKQKAAVQEKIKNREAQEMNVYRNEDLESAKKIIARVFEKIDETTKRSAGTIAIQDMKKIQELTEELRKVRMGTNFEKIRDTIQSLFALIEVINVQRYESIQKPSDTILPESLVTKVDLERELDMIENIRILKSLGAKIDIKKQDYATLGTSAIFWKFFQKDFLYKARNIGSLLYKTYDIIEFVLVIIASLLGIYTLANELVLFSPNQYGFSFSMITIGTRGLVVFMVRKWRNRLVNRLILLAALAIVLQYVLMWLVTTNFAL
ncbi:MAG TPA: hypothetical protein PKC87_04980 [Candidatus Absconditabacterales bacterium]|nr:hypothetical protein [Candidatus Absconditabacterales bacterium]